MGLVMVGIKPRTACCMGRMVAPASRGSFQDCVAFGSAGDAVLARQYGNHDLSIMDVISNL